jgi:hypothetical protein
MPFNAGGAALAHLTPRPTQTLWGDNYLSFDSGSGGGTFAQQFLPEIYEKEVERYGNRTVSGFLKMVGAEMPLQSDQVIWSEQGRIHVAYDGIATANQVEILSNTGNTITVPTGHLVQLHDTIIYLRSQTVTTLNYSFTVLNTKKDLLESLALSMLLLLSLVTDQS